MDDVNEGGAWRWLLNASFVPHWSFGVAKWSWAQSFQPRYRWLLSFRRNANGLNVLLQKKNEFQFHTYTLLITGQLKMLFSKNYTHHKADIFIFYNLFCRLAVRRAELSKSWKKKVFAAFPKFLKASRIDNLLYSSYILYGQKLKHHRITVLRLQFNE